MANNLRPNRDGKPRNLTRAFVGIALLGAALVGYNFALLSNASATSSSSPSVSAIWVEPSAGYSFLDTAISSAQHSVSLSMYELKDSNVVQELIRDAQRGLQVKVLLNAAYYGRSENDTAFQLLQSAHVAVHWAPNNQIFHAKYLVTDGTKAYIGTGNLVSSDYPDTRDFWVQVHNAQDIHAMTTTFLADFSGQALQAPTATDLVWSPGSLSALTTCISSAKHSLLIENEEMNQSSIEAALSKAARRGVTVRVIMTRQTSAIPALQTLLANGVHVSLLNSSQVYIHAKAICVDCQTKQARVFIGSENFSTSSLFYNRELGLITNSRVAISAVSRALESDFSAGTPLESTSSASSVGTGQSSSITIDAAPQTVARGSYVSLTITTEHARDTCSLSITLPSGYASHASGLGDAAADTARHITWSWRIGTSTSPGTATIHITCGSVSRSRNFSITS